LGASHFHAKGDRAEQGCLTLVHTPPSETSQTSAAHLPVAGLRQHGIRPVNEASFGCSSIPPCWLAPNSMPRGAVPCDWACCGHRLSSLFGSDERRQTAPTQWSHGPQCRADPYLVRWRAEGSEILELPRRGPLSLEGGLAARSDELWTNVKPRWARQSCLKWLAESAAAAAAARG
jgi:hypothetical protein